MKGPDSGPDDPTRCAGETLSAAAGGFQTELTRVRAHNTLTELIPIARPTFNEVIVLSSPLLLTWIGVSCKQLKSWVCSAGPYGIRFATSDAINRWEKINVPTHG